MLESEKQGIPGDVLEKEWHKNDPDLLALEKLQRETNLHPLIALFLCNRGIKDTAGAHSFLHPSLKDLPSPFLLKDMDKAAHRLADAVRRREKILIYGDYDADGVTATAVLWLFLKRMGAAVSHYIPDRIRDGYGLKTEIIRRFPDDKPDLLVTVDCGISNHEAVAFANGQGIEVIITDHHCVPDVLPPALAAINPKQPGCSYPDKELAGVGVAFNLIMALRRVLFHDSTAGAWPDRERPNLKEYLDLVAIGTIADMVPLRGVNRILVKEGLKIIDRGRRPGVAALKAVGLVNTAKVSSYDIGFRLAPRLNAAGRMGSADDALALLVTEDGVRAELIASGLDQANRRRQAVEEDMLAELAGYITEEVLQTEKALVYASPHWHRGVLGIVASRLAAKYARPAILFSLEDGKARGSGRSAAGLDLYELLTGCRELLEDFGGHREAAGLSLREENLPLFKEVFQTAVSDKVTTEDLVPRLWLEGSVQLSILREKSFLSDFYLLPPFGMGNPNPLLDTSPVKIIEQRLIGEKHVKLRVHQDGRVWDAMGFNMAPLPDAEFLEAALAFSLDTNNYQGRESLQLRVMDLKVMG
ncbi:MAG: single-stranded-DNA-specific exonuclease RecJ [Thermodesulfobacteriota bacterium]